MAVQTLPAATRLTAGSPVIADADLLPLFPMFDGQVELPTDWVRGDPRIFTPNSLKVDEDGLPLREALFVNHNADMRIEVDGPSLVGRSAANRGAGKKIIAVAPFLLASDQLQLDPALTPAQQTDARQKLYAAPHDALAYSGVQANGTMEVAQGISGEPVDRYSCLSTSATLTPTQSTDAPPGFTKSLKVAVQVASPTLPADHYSIVMQGIEAYRFTRLGFGTSNAQPFTVGFSCKVNRPGVYSIGCGNDDVSRTYVAPFTMNAANVWEFKTLTVPACFDGVWTQTNTRGLWFMFILAVGANRAGVPGAWRASAPGAGWYGAIGNVNGVAATSDTFQLAGFTFIPGIIGPTAAQSPLLQRPYDQELLLCRRYWWSSNPTTPKGAAVGTVGGYTFSAQVLALSTIRFTVPMRAVPSLQVWSNGVQNQVRNTQTGAPMSIGGGPSNTNFNTEGGCLVVVPNVTVSTWVDYDLIADARI
jgi:hypothetical protein